MKWMAVIVLIVFAIVFVVGAIQVALWLVRRESRPKAREAVLGLAVLLFGIGGLLRSLLGEGSFLAQLANVSAGVGLVCALAIEIKRILGQSKPIELGLGNSEEAISNGKPGIEKKA